MYSLLSSAIDTRILVLVAPLNYSCIIKMLTIKLFSYRDKASYKHATGRGRCSNLEPSTKMISGNGLEHAIQ